MSRPAVKRKWCSRCQTRRPHAYLWYVNLKDTCILWKADTGMCGCSQFGSEEPIYPDQPCHSGYQTSWTCCKCGKTKKRMEDNWTVEPKIVERIKISVSNAKKGKMGASFKKDDFADLIDEEDIL